MPDRKLRITLLASDTDQSPSTLEVTWADHVDGLSRCREVDCPKTTKNKRGVEIPTLLCPSLTPEAANKCAARKVEAWSPGITNGRRGDANVIGMDLIVLDVDHMSEAELRRLDAAVERLGWAAIIHSTHSHNPPDDHCYRFVFRCERTLTPDEIRPTRDWVQAQLGMRADEQTKNAERIYYLPTRPRGGVPYVFAACDGLDISPQAGAARHTTPAPPQNTAAVYFNPCENRRNGDIPALRKDLAHKIRGDPALALLLDGKAPAVEGQRDSILQHLAGVIAFGLPDASLEAMVEMGRTACAAMSPPERGEWLDVWRDKLIRACERKAAEDAERAEKNALKQYVMGQIAARAHPDPDGTENPNPFDEARVHEWAMKHAGSDEQFKKQWVIRHQGGNWVFCNGRYNKCLSDRDVEFSVVRDLGRAPIQLMTTDKDGNSVLRPMKRILFDFGTVARTVTASLALRESYYDAREETFHEAVCPVRYELRAKEHPEIGHWLELFGGAPLLDWVACVTRLDKPAAALYIEGPKGTGKNVLADGLARLWHKGGASAFKDVVGSNFNDSLTQCPLIHADEGIPKSDSIIDDLRRLIGTSVRPLNRKFMPVVSLDGCPRLIITANNDRVLLDTGAHLGPADIDAVTQRIRQLKAGPQSADYLTSLRVEHGYSYVESWIKDDHVARHALWLAETRMVDQTKRFLVEGDDAGQAEAMTMGTGQVGVVMEFLSRFLSDSAAVTTPKVRPGGGRLLVNTEALADKFAWERYVPSRKIPSARLISDSLRAISEGVDTVEGLDYFMVKPHMLVNWSRTNQVGSHAVIMGKIYG